MPIYIDNRHPSLRPAKSRLAQHLRAVLVAVGQRRAQVDVSLVDDDEIRQLNADYRGVDEVTDVLSFAMREAPGPEPVPILGDVIISLDTAVRQVEIVRLANAHADPAQVSAYGLSEEVAFLATHGVLHLLGYDHQTPKQAQRMEHLEGQLMASLTSLDVHAGDRTGHGLAAP